MATLQNKTTGDVLPLPSRLLVGRAPSCALQLADSRVSGEHAVVAWSGGTWRVRDLGSRNGTFVNGERIAPGEQQELHDGTVLAFGHEEISFSLLEAGAPSAVARNLDGGDLAVAEDGILALPSAEQAELTVFRDSRGRWVVEDSSGTRKASEGEVLKAGGRTWRLHLPAQLDGTATVDAGPTLDTIRLRFAVSRDEEHVQITIVHRGKEIELEEREHGYTLLTLARQRLDDAAEPLGEQGWVDRDLLLSMLQVDGNALNVAIYRARGQLSSSGVEGAAGIVEVRRGQRRLGLEPDRIEILGM